jgi:peptidyl-prolyl cis-trans isomerase SurA
MRTQTMLLMLALSLAPLPAAAGTRALDRVAAVVNEEMIPLSEVYQRAGPEIARLERDGMLNDERKQGALKRSLDDLIAEKLLAADEKASNIEVTDQEIDLAIEDVRKQNNMDAATFERALVSQGTSVTAYREKMKRDLGSMKLIGMKVRSKIKVADEDVKAEYARRAKAEESDFEVHARHIVIQVAKGASPAQEEAARKRAEELMRRARAGEDFGELAKKHSEGPSKADGGDVGFFKRGEMVGSFDKAAFALKPGEISDPVRSPFGWHVIQVVERRAGAPKPFEQVREELRDRLWREQMQRHTEQYVADLRKQAQVDVKVAELK